MVDKNQVFQCKKSISAFIEFTPSLKTIVMYSCGAKFNLCRVPTGQGKVRDFFFLQGQGKVREFCNMVRKIRKSSKVREKSGNFKIMLLLMLCICSFLTCCCLLLKKHISAVRHTF